MPATSDAAFYAFAVPAPEGFEGATLSPRPPAGTRKLEEYLLDWDEARATPDPRRTAVEFGLSAVRHACLVCGWDPGLASSAEGVPPPVT